MQFKTTLLGLLLMLITSFSFAQTIDVTVMTYNILNFPNSNTSAVDGNAARAGYFQQIVEDANADIIIVQELKTDAGATMLVDELNNNGTLGKNYARASVFTSYSGLGNMIIYNADLFNFANQVEVPRDNSQTEPDGGTAITPRAISYYELSYPANPTCSDQEVSLHIFSGHLKAGSSPASSTQIADEDRRTLGALDIMDYINANLSASDNIIFGGDFNFQDDTEPAYQTLTSGTNAFEDAIGNWDRNDNAETHKYTQSTRASFGSPAGNSNGGSTGGLDDRFDFWLHSNSVQNNSNKVSYINNSYETYSIASLSTNDGAHEGTHPLKLEVETMSDHYPVLMQLHIEAPASLCCAANATYNTTVSAGTYQTSNSINSNAMLSGAVNFHSNCILLEAGFDTNSQVFEAVINPCN